MVLYRIGQPYVDSMANTALAMPESAMPARSRHRVNVPWALLRDSRTADPRRYGRRPLPDQIAADHLRLEESLASPTPSADTARDVRRRLWRASGRRSGCMGHGSVSVCLLLVPVQGQPGCFASQRLE